MNLPGKKKVGQGISGRGNSLCIVRELPEGVCAFRKSSYTQVGAGIPWNVT